MLSGSRGNGDNNTAVTDSIVTQSESVAVGALSAPYGGGLRLVP